MKIDGKFVGSITDVVRCAWKITEKSSLGRSPRLVHTRVDQPRIGRLETRECLLIGLVRPVIGYATYVCRIFLARTRLSVLPEGAPTGCARPVEHECIAVDFT